MELSGAGPTCVLVALFIRAKLTLSWGPPKQAPLSNRCGVVLTSRIRVVCIVMAHGLAMMTIVYHMVPPDPAGSTAQDLAQFMVLLGIPLGCALAYAAVCPVDAPKAGARYATVVLLVWAALCVVNAVKWSYGAGRVTCVVRPIISITAAMILCWLSFTMYSRKGKELWPPIRVGTVLWNTIRMAGVVVIHELEGPSGYPPGHLSFEYACAINIAGAVAALAITPTNRLWLAKATGAATVQLNLGELSAFEAAAAALPAAALRAETLFDTGGTRSCCSSKQRAASEPPRRVTWSDQGDLVAPRHEAPAGRPAVVVGERIPEVAPAPGHPPWWASPSRRRTGPPTEERGWHPDPALAQSSTSWGSFGRAWEKEWATDWQERREAELQLARQQDMQLTVAGELMAPQAGRAPVPPLPPLQLGWPLLDAGAPATANAAADWARCVAARSGQHSDAPVRAPERQVAARPGLESRCSSESHHGSFSDRSEAEYIVTTKFLRYCAEQGLDVSGARRADGGLSGLGSTDGSTERGPAHLIKPLAPPAFRPFFSLLLFHPSRPLLIAPSSHRQARQLAECTQPLRRVQQRR